MPVPATTGQLRTKIEDMQIGDYIVCNYTASSGAVGTFSNFGGTAGTEIPVNGSATPNGTFYFVKVAKGLLVADRVVQYSISWDKLNVAKYIQGNSNIPITVVPTMTSSNTPSGIVTTSNEISGREAWKAFGVLDYNYVNSWYTNGLTINQWIAYEFPSPIVIKSYAMTVDSFSSNPARAPKDFRFEAWDGTSWVQLDRRTGITWVNNETKVFSVNNNTPYSKYRIFVETNNGDSYAIVIHQVSLFTIYPFVLRSLTGGVAYADANGNKSTTDLGYGAFPTNNEWDKFIVNFPQELIQSGKTLDDVFHWSGVATWCQDTPINGVQHPNTSSDVGQNTERTWRGYGLFTGNSHVNSRNEKMFGFSVSNYTATTLGFRPCFEYIES